MNRERILKGNTRQYISIADTDLLEQIGELLPHYTTFNKLANDALRIGIPILLEEKKHPQMVTPETDGVKEIPRNPILEDSINPQADEMIKILSQIAIHTTLSQEMLCGLYNVKAEELKSNQPFVGERFSRGRYNHTPDCLFEEEVDMLKELYPQDDDEK